MRYLAKLCASAFSCALLSLALALSPVAAQQRADQDFRPQVSEPAYGAGEGPLVLIDEAHNNFHTATGRYAPFAKLLSADGYRVEGLNGSLNSEALAEAKVLVIANPLSERNRSRAILPTYSAFTAEEIATIEAWVRDGGSLLLIADHMPWGGAAARLADAFGFLFADGFALARGGGGASRFAADGGLAEDHPVARGRGGGEAVDAVMTFTGQAFRVRPGVEAQPIITLGDDMVLLLPIEAWKFSKQTPRLSASGMLQGATLEHGAGRVAVFGEAGMFSAQISANGGRMGMNHPEATGNAQFALNVLHWLSRLY